MVPVVRTRDAIRSRRTPAARLFSVSMVGANLPVDVPVLILRIVRILGSELQVTDEE